MHAHGRAGSRKQLPGNWRHWDGERSPVHTKQAGTDGNPEPKHTPRTRASFHTRARAHAVKAPCGSEERKRSRACLTAYSHDPFLCQLRSGVSLVRSRQQERPSESRLMHVHEKATDDL